MKKALQRPNQTFSLGEIYEFKVKRLYASQCELTHEPTGITTYLQGTAKLKLFKGLAVKCRVTAVNDKHLKVELVDFRALERSTDDLTEEKLAELLGGYDLSWNARDFIRLLLTEERDKSFESLCHRWIQNLLNKNTDLRRVRRECSDLLELSPLLDLCGDTEREFYQERLTLLIEQTGYYIRAAELIDNELKEGATDTPAVFIDTLLNKLKVSGFVYHPGKNFNILSCLFLRQAELMNSRISELLDIISQRDLKSWSREPFRSALVKLLELYIRECDGRIDRTKDNQQLIDNNLRALAIQLLLLGDDDTSIADHRLNTARLCNIASYRTAPARLLDTAYYYLFHSDPERVSYTMSNIELVPHFLANKSIDAIDTTNTFTQNNAQLLISADGIQLRPARPEATTYAVLPRELKLWKGLQVWLNSRPETSLTGVKPNDIMPYISLWSEIEGEFFNTHPRPAAATPAVRRRRHRVDETVRISFVRQDHGDANKYYCQIEDEIGGEGYIYVKEDIVPYNIQTTLRHFFAPDGGRYVFEAVITDIEDDLFHFSMADIIKDNVQDYYGYDEDIICTVGSTPNANGVSPGVSREGVSVSLRNASDFKGIGKNSIVSCRLIGRAPGTFHIDCSINEPTTHDYDLNAAFRTLMKEMSVDTISEGSAAQEDEQLFDTDRVLDEPYVRELVFLIDRMAVADKDYVKSYNYLAFARILCMLIGWESQATYYKGRMDIITMLHYFAQNDKVDEARLSQLEDVNAELFSSNSILHERFMQLQAVSYMGNAAHNDDLYTLAKGSPELGEIAALVLAYNIVKDSQMEKTATDIHNKIKQLLNLKGYESGLKQYGAGKETIDVEYKSSIVFCAEDGTKGPNPEKQMTEILKVINSLLNTVGGTLYIGVNDLGMGIGVEDDLRQAPYFGDKDKYLRSITDAVSLKWGNAVATTYIKDIDWDDDNKDKDVLVVKVRPLPQGVALDGSWYVRKGSSKRRLTKDEFELYQRVDRDLPPEALADLPAVTVSTEPEAAEAPAPLVTTKEDCIRTSRIRKNIVADFIDYDNYVEPVALFKFMGNSKFKRLSQYDWDDETSLLTLTVLEQEEKGMLVLGYDNGHIVKVPVEELLGYQEREYARYSGAKLLFASIARDEDAVLTILKENKTKPRVVMRADTLSKFHTEGLLDAGVLPYNEGLASEVIAYEVIPAAHKDEFTGILDKRESFIGHPANAVTQSMADRLHAWGVTEI